MADKILNCWEYKGCGRGPGGTHSSPDKICPAVTDTSSDGINRGTNGGRCCWLVSGTFCDGKVQGIFAKKLETCFSCDFYQLVLREET